MFLYLQGNGKNEIYYKEIFYKYLYLIFKTSTTIVYQRHYQYIIYVVFFFLRKYFPVQKEYAFRNIKFINMLWHLKNLYVNIKYSHGNTEFIFYHLTKFNP